MGELVPAFFRSVVQTQRDQGNSTTQAKVCHKLQVSRKEKEKKNQMIRTGVYTQLFLFLGPIKQLPNINLSPLLFKVRHLSVSLMAEDSLHFSSGKS